MVACFLPLDVRMMVHQEEQLMLCCSQTTNDSARDLEVPLMMALRLAAVFPAMLQAMKKVKGRRNGQHAQALKTRLPSPLPRIALRLTGSCTKSALCQRENKYIYILPVIMADAFA